MIAIGLVVGELAAVVAFSGSIDRLLDERAARTAESTPAASQAAAEMDRSRTARGGLDDAVEQAVQRRQEALVVARCEFNPSAATARKPHITGDTRRRTRKPGTANGVSRRTPSGRWTARWRSPRRAGSRAGRSRSPTASGPLRRPGEAAMADADRGLGARWVAMNELHACQSGPALVTATARRLRFFVAAEPAAADPEAVAGRDVPGSRRTAARRRCAIVRNWSADTAIAVKRAEVRAAVDNLWAEQQLVQ